jgi:predicted nucleic acid-binding protein
LIYAASKAADDEAKRAVARQILSQPALGFSVQVMQEFYAAAVTKQRLQMTHGEAAAVLRSLAAFPVLPLTRELVLEAAEAQQRFQTSYWDAAILVAARRLGCQTVYSEDLNHGQLYDGVRVVNPFASDAPSPTA